jgi:hypothetical protein
MRVQLLYFDGCPNWEVAGARLRDALVAVGIAELIEPVEVTSQEDAERLGFRGSPTVMVDGRDLFAEPADAADAGVGLVCRVYSTPEGLSGAPTTEQLVDALADLAAGRDAT